MELNAIKALVSAGHIVICCGGGGIPVAIKGKNVIGVECVIDKDRTSALLALDLNADILIMLTDVECLYRDWGTPQAEAIRVLDVSNMSARDTEFVASLEAGSMGPKVQSGIEFASKTGGWAAIGALTDLPEILAGTKGTRMQKGAKVRVESTYKVPKKMDEWTQEDVLFWLTDHLRVSPENANKIITAGYNSGLRLKHLHDDFLRDMGLSWMTSNHMIDEIEKVVLGKKELFVDAQPYRWPYNRDLTPHNTALVIIDMQRDFCEKGGYIDAMGYSLENARAIIPTLQLLLSTMRDLGFYIIHTREGHRPSLSDCPPVKHWRSLNNSRIGIGDVGPLGRILVKGEPGWDIIEELKPDYDSEIVIDKPGKGSFVATDLELILRTNKIQNLIITGVTTDVCVHTTLREANDRGFECLIVTDACAALDKEVHNAVIKSVQMSGGIFGAVADTRTLLHALTALETRD